MKVSKNFEQSVCVLMMLALSKDHAPLTSALISQKLAVSESYLKKILSRLSNAHLITSKSGKSGGFTMGQAVNSISFLDVYQAINNDKAIFEAYGFAERVFNYSQTAKAEQNEMQTKVDSINATFMNLLSKEKISFLLTDSNGNQLAPIDWQKVGE
ncbi:RrF2 family transcriptional regulator [Lactobacillaceae bacterium Melli_B4]